MNRCFHGFDSRNCITCLSKGIQDQYWRQGLTPNSIPVPQCFKVNEKEIAVKEQKPKKTAKTKLSRDEQIRIAALNAAITVQCSNNFDQDDYPIFNSVTNLAKHYEIYIRTGEII